jgi:transcriptional regulator with XRE-family HTH domain
LPKPVQPPTSERQAETRRITAQLGETVEALRDERQLTNARLAGVSGVTLDELRGITKRHTDPRLSTTLRLCGGLGVSVEELLGGLPIPQSPRPPKRPYYGTAKRITKTGGREHAGR